MHVSFARLRNVVLALLVAVTGLVVLAGPAAANQGNITVTQKACVDGDTVRVTYQVSWSAVPVNARNTHIYSRTGTTTFNGAWDDSAANAAAWANVDRGALDSEAGTRSWTVSLDKSQFGGTASVNGPWEYAYFPWTNGNTGSRFHDTRVEGFDWNLCAQIPEGFEICHATGVTPQTTTIEQVRKYEINKPSGSGQLSGHVGAAHNNGLDIIPPIPGYLPNGQNWTTYGQEVWNGIGGVHCEVPRTDATASVTVTDPSCQSVSGVTFNSLHATASPTTPNLAPGTHSVTFTSVDGHRFADGSRTKTVSYTVADRLDADLDKCAAADATASVTVTDPTCQSVSGVTFNAVNSTASPASPNLNPGTHSVTFTAGSGHRFADGSRTKTVSYTVAERLSADLDACAAKDATAAVDLVSQESCTSPSVVEFTAAHATASPAVPATEPGDYSVTFTADSGHRFADGTRTDTLDYTIDPKLSADDNQCAAKDATAAVDLVSQESCTSPSVVEFTAAHATASPAVPATEPGDYSVTFTADSGHRFADGTRTDTLDYTIDPKLSADDNQCAAKDATAAVDLVSQESCTSPSVVEFTAAHATASPAVPATEPGDYSVTFTADSGHRFADGTRTDTLDYTIDPKLSADDNQCAAKDATAVVTVTDPTCQSASGATFSVVNATSDPAVPATEPGDYSVLFTADSGHRFANGSRTLSVPYSIDSKLSADDDQCAAKDASAAVELATDETCTNPSTVTFSVVNATSDPAVPATEPGDYSVLFTADSGHRFANGSRTLSVPYSIDSKLSADDDQCAAKDASAAVELATDETCTNPSTVTFSVVNATSDPAVPATEPGDYSVTFTADSGHRFEDGSRRVTLDYSISAPIDADDEQCAAQDASAAVELVTDETCTNPSTVTFTLVNASAAPAVPATEPGEHSVTFTADSGHRFANGSRTLVVPYIVVPKLSADDDLCAERDASAAAGTVADASCTGASVVEFTAAHATAEPAVPATAPGDYSVTFTADPGHRFADGTRTVTLDYAISAPIDADDDQCAEQGAAAGVVLATQESCTSPSVVEFTAVHATASPAVPATEPGEHSVTFTADAGHRFPDGARTVTLDYAISGPLGADDDLCAERDASAAAGTVADASCTGASVLEFTAAHATAEPTVPATELGEHSVTFTADSGHRFADGARTLTLDYTITGPIDADDDLCAEKDAVAALFAAEPTCLGGETLVLGDPVFATWGEPTLTEGPGDYSVVATADAGHRFVNGERTRTFAGSLEGALDPLGEDCLEVEGEQETQTLEHEVTAIEVKGEQSPGPTPVPTPVPTTVDAGEDGRSPFDSEHHPLWLMAIGGGLGLMGVAGSRRRKTADR